MLESRLEFSSIKKGQDWHGSSAHSDYKDNGTNVLLDANENAHGPGLSFGNGRLKGDHRSGPEIDLLGLHRYPDP